MSRWTAEAHRLATLDRSIDSIATALRAEYGAGRAEQREADAVVCDGEPENFVGDLLFLDPYEDACQCCAAAIRAQNFSGRPELDPGSTEPTGCSRSASTAPSGLSLSTGGVGAGARCGTVCCGSGTPPAR